MATELWPNNDHVYYSPSMGKIYIGQLIAWVFSMPHDTVKLGEL